MAAPIPTKLFGAAEERRFMTAIYWGQKAA